MKKIIAVVLALVMLFSFTACGEKEIPQNVFDILINLAPQTQEYIDSFNLSGTYKQNLDGTYHFVVKAKVDYSPEVIIQYAPQQYINVFDFDYNQGYLKIEFDYPSQKAGASDINITLKEGMSSVDDPTIIISRSKLGI